MAKKKHKPDEIKNIEEWQRLGSRCTALAPLPDVSRSGLLFAEGMRDE